MHELSVLAAVQPVSEALESLSVPHYLTGSVISSFYGVARATVDADLVADLRVIHAEPFAARLGAAYYAEADIIREAIHARTMFNVIHFETMVKVDVYPVATLYDRTCMARRLRDTLDPAGDGPLFAVASAEDVLLHKLLWYRMGGHVSERQWGDVLGVLRVRGRHLDRDHLARWAEQLGITDLLERALDEAGLTGSA